MVGGTSIGSGAGALRAYVALVHPIPVLIVTTATALFGLLVSGGHPPAGRYAALLGAILGGQIAIGALNDYGDRELDIGRPEKPIAAGRIRPKAALGIVLAGLAAILIAGTTLGSRSLLLACIGTGAGLVYDLRAKRTAWSWLPYAVALPLLPIWVWDALDRFDSRLLLLYPLGALMVVAVHLAQSLPDAERDAVAGSRGLAARLGRDSAQRAALLATMLTCLEVGLAAPALTLRPAAAVGAAGLTLVSLIGAVGAARRSPGWAERHLFKVLALDAVLLGAGWLLAIAG